MPDKPEIEKLRVLHDLHTQFDVPEAIRKTLELQLSPDDQGRIERFISGFRIENWFEWIFSAMPWVQLIHGLDQQQFPMRSKDKYQVPDFLLLVETSTLEQRPLLVEVKRVPKGKSSLKLQESQIALCERYAAKLQIPLVYAVYWERLSVWTLNTPDTFEQKSSSRKLPMSSAIELDCGAILGDISHMVSPALIRVSRYSTQNVTGNLVRHKKYGRLVSDVASLGERKLEMNSLESAALDSMLTMIQVKDMNLSNEETELTETLDTVYILKLSSWITRHLATIKTQPSEQNANLSACVITHLMKKLNCPLLHLFPFGRSKQLERLDELFSLSKEESAA